MFGKTMASAALLIVAMSVRADVSIGTQVITTGTKIEVLEPGPDLQAIIDGIADAGSSKPYLLQLGPGVYPVPALLIMKPYVSIQGGGRGVTVLFANYNASTTGVVQGASYTSLTDLSVHNTSGASSFDAYGIASNAATHQLIERVDVKVTGGSDENEGIISLNGSSPTISHVTVEVEGGATGCTAILNEDSGGTLSNVTALASGGTETFGVLNRNSSPTMKHLTARASGDWDNVAVVVGSGILVDSTAAASGGNSNIGVSTNSGARLTNVLATATGGDDNIAISAYSSTLNNVVAKAVGGSVSNIGFQRAVYSALPMTEIRGSTLWGTTAGVDFHNQSDPFVISDTKIIGGVTGDVLANINCRNTYDENLADVSC